MPSLSECFHSLPQRFKADRAGEFRATIHFYLDGEHPAWTVAIAEGQVEVAKGHIGEATCTVHSSAETYMDLENGNTSPEMAFMFGKVKVSHPPQMLKYSKLFHRLAEQ